MIDSSIHSKINQLLPQWQCKRCEYKDCADYAHAIIKGADINRCPPGGEKVLADLYSFASKVLNRTEVELAHQQVINPILKAAGDKQVAKINPNACIGCARCIIACPISAIIGGKRALHMVITDVCSGCELCVPVCPMDCISFEKEAKWQDDDLRKGIYKKQMERLLRVKNNRKKTVIKNKSQWLKAQMQQSLIAAKEKLNTR